MARGESDGERASVAAVLLFAAGARPTAAAIRALAASGNFAISADPGDSFADGSKGSTWLEILASGLTFDLLGLAPGPSAALPPRAHSFGLGDDSEAELVEAVALRPGPHLATGARAMPIIRQLALLAAQLAELPELRAVAWPPARIWSAPRHFRDLVLRWSEGGVFPGLGLVALARMPDGGIQSEGMALFIGQELRLEPELARDPPAGTKIGLRLLHWLSEHGPLAGSETVAAPDGQQLRIAPSPNGRFVRVWVG